MKIIKRITVQIYISAFAKTELSNRKSMIHVIKEWERDNYFG